MPCTSAAPFSEFRFYEPPLGFEGAPGCDVTTTSLWSLDVWSFAVYVAGRGIGFSVD